MANNDRSKWDFYLDMNVIEFLNSVAFYKDKAEDDIKTAEEVRKKYA